MKIQPVSPALNAVAFTARPVFGFISLSRIHQSSQRLVSGLLGPSCTAPSMPVQTRPSPEGAASPHKWSHHKPNILEVKSGGECVTWELAVSPPSDTRQEQSKKEEPRSAPQVHGPETIVHLLCPLAPAGVVVSRLGKDCCLMAGGEAGVWQLTCDPLLTIPYVPWGS